MINNTRVVRTYKVKNKYYNSAMKRAKKEGGNLAKLLECVVIGYASGLDLTLNNFMQISQLENTKNNLNNK